MTGGYGSRLDPLRLDLDGYLSECDTNTFVSTRSSFNAENCGEDDCQTVQSLSGKIEAASSQVTPSLHVSMEVTPSPPVRMEVAPSPVEMEVPSSYPVSVEVTPTPLERMEVTPSPPAKMEVGEPSTTVTLTTEQQQVLDFVRAGEVDYLNIFFV